MTMYGSNHRSFPISLTAAVSATRRLSRERRVWSGLSCVLPTSPHRPRYPNSCSGALNWATGETVAVKEITLANIPKGEISQIMVGDRSLLHHRPDHLHDSPSVRDRPAQESECTCVYIKFTLPADSGSASEYRQIQGVLQDPRISVHHPRVCHILYSQTIPLNSVPQILRKWVPARHLQTVRKVPGESSSRVYMPGPRRIGISSRPGCNTSRYQGRKYFNKQGRLC